MDPKKQEGAWWRRGEPFRVLGIDLGQRCAAAAAIIDVHRGEGFWEIGHADGQVWSANLLAMRQLRLQGEDAEVMAGGVRKREQHGYRGRLAVKEEGLDETEEAFGLLRPLAPNETAAQTNAERLCVHPDLRFVAEQNRWLLRAFRQAQGHLARYHRWLGFLRRDEIGDDSWDEIVKQDLRPDWSEAAKVRQRKEVQQVIEREILRLQRELPCILVRIANRVAPLRGRSWRWIESGRTADGRPYHQLEQTGPNLGKVRIRGQGGLSFARIEMIEELRHRAQSLNRALQRAPGEPARFGRSLAGDLLPDPCPELSKKLDRIKEQRVNQTAHLILAEALGVEPCVHTVDPYIRRKFDIHAEYRRVKGREPVDFIVIEDLSRYRTSQGRAPSENSRLMKWCHRQISAKLKELCQAFGIPVIETPAAYSSRFCSRTGVAGFRAVEIHRQDCNKFRWRRQIDQINEKGASATPEAKSAGELFRRLEEINRYASHGFKYSLLAPQPGGPIFIAASGDSPPMQADINAAINLALRAIAAPDAHRILTKIRAEAASDGVFAPKRGNKREKARFLDGDCFLAKEDSDRREFASIARRATNFFVDIGQVAVFGRASHPQVGKLPLANGRGLWGSVKQIQWERCMELNDRRIAAAKRKQEEEDQLP
jgi:IS605 OrfB family transposase